MEFPKSEMLPDCRSVCLAAARCVKQICLLSVHIAASKCCQQECSQREAVFAA